MRFLTPTLCLFLALAGESAASASWHKPKSVPPQARSSSSSDARIFKREQNGINYNVFEHRATNSSISFVENSGICETTPGVNTYSGYLSVGTNMSMFFWFFEARNNASEAPLAMWLNGGPGCSSMIGLFQENGPCNFPVNGSTDEPTLNPYSWNNYAVRWNTLLVWYKMWLLTPQIRICFMSTSPLALGSVSGRITPHPLSLRPRLCGLSCRRSLTLSPSIRHGSLLSGQRVMAGIMGPSSQVCASCFAQFKGLHFKRSNSSGGKHLSLTRSTDYFESQNAAISNGTITGETINMTALGINNGWFDATIQYQAYVDFAYNNTWRQLINETQHTELQQAYETDCAPLLAECTTLTGNDEACLNADDACYSDVEGVVESGMDFDVYDVVSVTVSLPIHGAVD